MKTLLILTLHLPLQFVSTQNVILGPWQRIKYTGTKALTGRFGHAGGFMSSTNELLLFGGYDGADDVNDFISIKTSTSAGSQITTAIPFSARYLMGQAATANDFYVHGGFSSVTSSAFGDFWKYNVQTKQWTSFTDAPFARICHCLEVDTTRNQLILFGGYLAMSVIFIEYSNDMWTFSITSNTWTQETPLTFTPLPGKRFKQACAFNSQSRLFHIHGGSGGTSVFYQDLWSYDFDWKRWSLMNSGNANVQRQSHSMAYSKSFNSLLIFLGVQPDNTPLNSIYQYSLSNRLAGWTRVQVAGTPISSRESFSTGFNAQTGDYYVFGGRAAQSSDSELWKIQIDNLPISSSVSLAPVTSNPVSTRFTTPVSLSSMAVSRNQQLSLTSTFIQQSIFQSFPNSSIDFGVTIDSSSITSSRNQSQLISTTSDKTLSTGRGTNGILLNDGRSTSESSLTVWDSYQLNIIIASTLTLLVIWLCCYYHRRRKRKLTTSQSLNTLSSTPQSKSFTTSSGTQSIEMTTNRRSTLKTMMSGSDSTQYTSDQTMEITLASRELGISVPAYLHMEYACSVRETKVLAQGGFGTVILADALDQKLKQYGDVVVVKQLKKQKLSERDVQIFYQEISLMEYLKNEKFVAKLLGYSTDPFCLIMKYYEMGSLKQFIKTATNRCMLHVHAFSRDIACGLSAMHGKGIVHNDLKPDNVLLEMSSAGEPFCVLTDLGISQIITEQVLKVKQFHAVQIRGLSMVYAAPERIEIFRKKMLLNATDRQTRYSWDLYSLGVLMFELLTGLNKFYE